MGFDFNKFLSFLKKQKKTVKREDFENEKDVFEEEDESFDSDEDLIDEEGDKEEEKKDFVDKKRNTKKNLKNLFANLKNKKLIISAAAAGVVLVVGGAVVLPMVMGYSGKKQAEKIGNISDINVPPAYKPKISHKKELYHNKKTKDHYNIAKQHINRVSTGLSKNKTKKSKPLVISNPYSVSKKTLKTETLSENKHIYSNLNINKNAEFNIQKNKIDQITAQLENTSKNIKTIERHLISGKLKGEKDPIGLMDKTIIKNRNFDLYLQSQIQLMRKLISYYKQKAELEKTLELYKMAYYKNKNMSGENRLNNGIDVQTQKMTMILKNVVAPLQNQINQLQKQLKEQKRKKHKNENHNIQSNLDFNKMSGTKLSDLNIFAKNNKYIAVIHTDNGDKIYEEGDYFNGYKIDKILPNMIVFEKNGQKFYYTYNQTLNIKYQVAKIKLPNEISKSEVKTGNKNKTKVKQYHSVSKQELLQKLLQKKLREMR
jgi:hypothetical protein